MTGCTSEDTQARLTRRAIDHAGLSAGEVWVNYFGLTGTVGEFEVDAYLNGLLALPAIQRDLLSHAVNELLQGTPGALRAPYSRTPGGECPPTWREGPEDG
ncbi:hypothetical protein [Sinomonas terrae]|uniref:Uncharacterized protein n=1 Tax=Sinomonas terrae TaxID=2908838 RepID=A0ABS9U024_9MICC|nr:hypothetical protein [Sinomonas terrae]MCH6469862.1 hypothetical protein [Sinomonas terrae]